MLNFVRAQEPSRTVEDFIHSRNREHVGTPFVGSSESQAFYDQTETDLTVRKSPYRSAKASVKTSSAQRLRKGNVLEAAPKNVTIDSFLRAAADCNLQQLTVCIAHGFPVDSVDMFGWTALMCAAQKGHFDAVRLLINSGASHTLQNKKHQTAADLAELSRHPQIAAYLVEFQNYEAVDKESTTEDSVDLQPFYCDTCAVTFYSTSPRDHQSSTIHQLSSGFTGPSRPCFAMSQSNVGFRLMKKIGWDESKGLGAEEDGRWYPVRTIFKQDKKGLGSGRYVAQVTHYPHLLQKKAVTPATATTTKREMQKDIRRRKRKEINLRRSLQGL
ncbi:G patch domain and ankyrin repeat-containing protein 1 homolog [Paramacrobiotus metropolitanus]|uniref:G patch domain and ankyrin repeat-containing protein 1 homolog n=1 Tax=Paramacrobiotus metropolitanus TaxID=2943436 RepID=UPI0024457D16|nr:G patch domain and ankyrin repeat-containing protein 1 homolog [Paramacrobiotus metropolitanus]